MKSTGLGSKVKGHVSSRVLLPAHRLRQLLQPLLQLQRKLLVTFLTHRLHVKLHKLVPAKRTRNTNQMNPRTDGRRTDGPRLILLRAG